MAECSYARCQQERRAIRKDLQRWTKNMVHILGLERVAEELMGRRKWKLYQDALVPRRNDADEQTSDDSMPASEGPPPGLKIKTIEQINAPERDGEIPRVETETNCEKRPETILESLIKRPSTHPKVEYPEEPSDWKPADKCYFCVDGEPGGAAEGRTGAGGATSPASESDSSSVSGAKSPSAGPPLLQHLLQLHTQNPQAVAAQFQQMMATLAALSSGLVPPAQALLMQRLMQNRYQQDRISAEMVEKVSVSSNSPSLNSEQPLDLSAKSNSSGTPPPDNKYMDNARLKRTILEGSSCNSARRAYTEEELQSALKDIQTGKLGTRRAAVVYGIPRSTLRNKVYKMASDMNHESDVESDPERDSPPSVILKIPTFPPPDEKSSSPATSVSTPVTPITPIIAPNQPSLNPPSQLLLPPSVFADPPSTQHLFTSLSDVIAKSISQKFQQPLDRPSPDMSFMRPDRHVSVIKNPADGPRPFPSPGNSRSVNNNNGQPAAGGKGTRPKRGKYRNYDRDSLVEAVKAVQRGEMSVHRAGSYYGVPHSTLEYKVKERHLMRPRKREPKPPQDVKPQPPKPAPKPPTKPFSNGMNGPDSPYPPGYPFWAPGFAPPPHNDLYASHMMRRLRDEVPPANGSFLEGIIRSSLANERPGAALLQRLAEPTRRPPERLPEDGAPAARRPRLDGSDLRLAADMRDAVQRLRADKARRSPPPGPPPSSTTLVPSAPAPSPPPAPPDRA